MKKQKQIKVSALALFIMAIIVTGCKSDDENIAPITVTTADFTIAIDENPTVGQSIGKVTGKASQGEVSFTLTSQDPKNAISIDAKTGELKVKEVSLFDFETRTSIIGVVTVKSGTVSKEAKITITIADVDETDPPTVIVTTTDFKTEINENPEVGQSIGVVSGTASEGDVTFSITSQEPADALSINSATGELNVKNPSLFDFETRTTITAVVKVMSGEVSKNATVNITLKDIAASWKIVGKAGFSVGRTYEHSLVISNGIPYVAYGDIGNGFKAMVMKYENGSWKHVGSETGVSKGGAGHPSLKFYNGIPYMAYSDHNSERKTSLVKFEGGVWKNVGVAGFSAVRASHQSLAINNGVPYVAYSQNGNDGKTTVMKFEADKWINVGEERFSAGFASYQSLVIDNNIPYVAYKDQNNGNKTTVMHFKDGKWSNVGNTEVSAGRAEYQSMVIDNGILYVAYKDYVNGGKTTVMKYENGAWSTVGNPGFSTRSARYQSLVIHNNIPYVAYIDGGTEVTVMKFEENKWQKIGTAAGYTLSEARSVSLVVDNKVPYVSYSDSVNESKTTVIKFDE
ncbi:cadherin repeat domain-containing protein [Aquimarina sp. Aq78]|uniref:cadherin repeat domain-containing protein n=1 Tax=Aquimarina sp. Aq78 TaxID=1191889 RepID=UPI000D0FADC2|nr:cadherin repeat domain-containing protein [Aquimarina sp. Aq78]